MVEVGRILAASWRSGSKRLFLNGTGLELEEGLLTISNIVKALLQSVRERRFASNIESVSSQGSPHDLPKVITFPYSRHSSYDELCDLVRAFQPRDVYPCTVDEQYWDDGKFSFNQTNISLRSTKEISASEVSSVVYVLVGAFVMSKRWRNGGKVESKDMLVSRHIPQQTLNLLLNWPFPTAPSKPDLF